MIKERPLLLSGPMVCATREHRKTQTRRVVSREIQKGPGFTAQAIYEDGGGNWIAWGHDEPHLAAFTKTAYPNGEGFRCPYGKVGDRLWVREGFGYFSPRLYDLPRALEEGLFKFDEEYNKQPEIGRSLSVRGVGYHADGPHMYEPTDGKWYPCIYMPRWASRITLEIVSVRVERVQDISEEDAMAEGCKKGDWVTFGGKLGCFSMEVSRNALSAKEAYHCLWDSLNGKKPGFAWADNPWVWVITFRVVEAA